MQLSGKTNFEVSAYCIVIQNSCAMVFQARINCTQDLALSVTADISAP